MIMASNALQSSTKKRKASTNDVVNPKESKISPNTTTTTSANELSASKPTNKKKKINNLKSAATKNSSPGISSSSDIDSFKPFDLAQIQMKIKNLSKCVPEVPDEGLDPNSKDIVKEWTMSMQAVIEQFNLLLTCIAAATYKWGSDRTGAADQNLSLLSSELGNSQEQISSSVSQRLTNVLAPVVEIVTKETIVKKVKDEKTGEEYEKRTNEFSREQNDPEFIHLCHVVLCRNAAMLRHVVLTNFHKVGKCIEDYLKATKKDGNQSRSAGFY